MLRNRLFDGTWVLHDAPTDQVGSEKDQILELLDLPEDQKKKEEKEDGSTESTDEQDTSTEEDTEEVDQEEQKEDEEDTTPENGTSDDGTEEDGKASGKEEGTGDVPKLTPLQEELNRLSELLNSRGEEKKVETKKEKKDEKEKADVSKTNNITDDEFADIQTDKDAFNKYIAKIITETIQATREEVKQEYQNLESNVDNKINNTFDLKLAFQKFWQANTDLERFKPYVHTLITSIAKQEPEKNIIEIFAQAGEEARKNIGLYTKEKEGKKQEPKKKKKPTTLPKGQQTRTESETKELNELQQDFMNLRNVQQ